MKTTAVFVVGRATYGTCIPNLAFRDTTPAGSRGPVTGSGRLAAYQRLTTSLGATLRVRNTLCPPDQVPQWSHRTCCGPGTGVATKSVFKVF